MSTLFQKTQDFKVWRQGVKDQSIGFVPTMGNLHPGHLGLVEQSLKDNDITIVSIFVNPKQFGPNEDFERYPRTLAADIHALEQFKDDNKDLIIYAPESAADFYHNQFNSIISVKSFQDQLCGAKRPGHFDGVTTVVYKLFATTKPTRAYFGQKDYQQSLIIQKMVLDLEIPVDIILMPISREEDGLARSSRNQYLGPKERTTALKLSYAIKDLEKKVKKAKKDDIFHAVPAWIQEIKKNDSHFEYLEILDAEDLEAIRPQTKTVLIAGAYQLGATRLIDNILVPLNYA